jgi:hypothetical protein
MNTYKINDPNYNKSEEFQKYLKDNNGVGYLNIRAFSANEAIPIKGVKITITKLIGNNNVIFFEGETDDSGMINNIALPTPKLGGDNLISPNKETYNIISYYKPENLKQEYQANIYDGIYVIQNINIIPEMKMGDQFGY